MKLSAKTEYACLAMLQLAADHTAVGPTPLRSLAGRQQIPEGFLVQILQDLRRAGLVRSVRGAGGGYRLARDPQDVSLAEVIVAIEGAADETDSLEAISPLAAALQSVCAELGDERQRRLRDCSLAAMIEQAAAPREAMWYI